MSGEIVAETVVRVTSTGSLDGNIVARAINVDKGGTFSGQLIIGRRAISRQNHFRTWRQKASQASEKVEASSTSFGFYPPRVNVRLMQSCFRAVLTSGWENTSISPVLIDKARLHRKRIA